MLRLKRFIWAKIKKANIPQGFQAVARRRRGKNQRVYEGFLPGSRIKYGTSVIEDESTLPQRHSFKGKGRQHICLLLCLVSITMTHADSREQQQATELKTILEKQNLLIRDPFIKETLEQIIHRLQLVLPNAISTPDVLLIHDPEINAFAGPVGMMGIYTGLILACDSADEFAGVMAHELAHHSQQHLLRGQEYQDELRVPQIASIIGAIALSAIDPQLGMGAMSLGSTLSIQKQLSFSRDMEMEADRVGILVLKKAGFDPQGLTRFFTRLSANEQLNHSKQTSYLRTHPHSYERLAETTDLMGPNKSTAFKFDILHQDFLYALERTRVLYSGRPQPSSFYKKLGEPQQLMHKHAWQYGYAYALSVDGQISLAWQYLRPLLNSKEQNSFYPWILAAELTEKEGHPARALTYLANAWRKQPNNQALFLSYLKGLYANQHYALAEQLLTKEQFQNIPLNEDYVILATQIYVANHHPARAYYLRANYAKQLGQKIMAKRYLTTALQQDNLDQPLRAKLTIELDQMKLIENNKEK